MEPLELEHHPAEAARWFVIAQPLLDTTLHRAAAGEDVGVLIAELFTRAANPADAQSRVIELGLPELEAFVRSETARA